MNIRFEGGCQRMPYLIVPTATNAKRIARCWHYQHLAHKAGSYGSNNTIKRQGQQWLCLFDFCNIFRTLKLDQLVVISHSKIELSNLVSIPLLVTDNRKSRKKLCIRLYSYMWRQVAESHALLCLHTPPGIITFIFDIYSFWSTVLFIPFLSGIYHIES
jgi:hypothetical protein